MLPPFDSVSLTGTLTPTPPPTNAQLQAAFQSSIAVANILSLGHDLGQDQGQTTKQQATTNDTDDATSDTANPPLIQPHTSTTPHPSIALFSHVDSAGVYANNSALLTTLVQSSQSSQSSHPSQPTVTPPPLFKLTNILANAATSTHTSNILKNDALSYQASCVLDTRTLSSYKASKSLSLSASLVSTSFTLPDPLTPLFHLKSQGWRLISIPRESGGREGWRTTRLDTPITSTEPVAVDLSTYPLTEATPDTHHLSTASNVNQLKNKAVDQTFDNERFVRNHKAGANLKRKARANLLDIKFTLVAVCKQAGTVQSTSISRRELGNVMEIGTDSSLKCTQDSNELGNGLDTDESLKCMQDSYYAVSFFKAIRRGLVSEAAQKGNAMVSESCLGGGSCGFKIRVDCAFVCFNPLFMHSAFI